MGKYTQTEQDSGSPRKAGAHRSSNSDIEGNDSGAVNSEIIIFTVALPCGRLFHYSFLTYQVHMIRLLVVI